MSKLLFEIDGPYQVPCYRGKGGRAIEEDDIPKFWSDHPHAGKRRGCYVFVIRVPKGFTPIYVGKTTNSFKGECFADHKIRKYQRGLADYASGTPMIFFLHPKKQTGRVNKRVIDDVETFLINMCHSKNPKLLNQRKKQKEEWGICGVFSGGTGRASKAATQFSRMLF